MTTHIDVLGAQWAYDLGQQALRDARTDIEGVMKPAANPFTTESLHHRYWRLGWLGREFHYPAPVVH